MAERVDSVVIGAGVVGLAIARALALKGREVIVLEQAEAIGMETSSRNSEVIHAGIYYPKDSLKAKLCVAGKHMLYDYCRDHGVPFNNCGKLIVATNDDQVAELDAIQAKAADNGVQDLRKVSGAELAELEPALNAKAALLSPSTGILDSHSFMLALQGDAEDRGAMVAFHTPVEHLTAIEDGYRLQTGGEASMNLDTAIVVNAAGHGAQFVARCMDTYPREIIPPQYYAKGNYFTVQGRVPFSRLIYPVPEQAGLGVHLTLDLGGQGRFGPDVEWVDWLHYEVDPTRAENFYAAIRTYWPDLKDDSLMPDYAGIRPKIQAPGEAARDFMIAGPESHGMDGLVHLFGIESPGLTAALAIADEVTERLRL